MDVHAAVLTEFGVPLTVTGLRYRDPAPHELLIRNTAAPFCATDWLGWKGMRNKKPPVVLGHTAVGVVEATGSEVSGLTPGDRVLVAGTPECKECFYCGIGRPDQCSALLESPEPVVATWADGSPVKAAGRVGAYASHLIADRNQVWALDTGLPDAVLSLLGCGVLTGHGAVNNIAGVTPGQSVAVLGLGHLGLWMVQAARVAGAGRIIGLDRVASRRETALALGATDVIDPAVSDPVAAVRELTEGRGADVALEAAGPELAVQQAVAMSRRAGTVVLSGVDQFDADVRLPQLAIAIQGRRILACQNGQSVLDRDLPLVIGRLERGDYSAERIITREYDLREANEALEASGALRDLSGVFTSFGR